MSIAFYNMNSEFFNIKHMEFVKLRFCEVKFALLKFCFTFESVNFHGIIDLVVLLVAASQNKVCFFPLKTKTTKKHFAIIIPL